MSDSEFIVLGYKVSVTGSHRVIIMDPLSDLTDNYIDNIIYYLYSEGFIDNEETIYCEVVDEADNI